MPVSHRLSQILVVHTITSGPILSLFLIKGLIEHTCLEICSIRKKHDIVDLQILSWNSKSWSLQISFKSEIYTYTNHILIPLPSQLLQGYPTANHLGHRCLCKPNLGYKAKTIGHQRYDLKSPCLEMAGAYQVSTTACWGNCWCLFFHTVDGSELWLDQWIRMLIPLFIRF